MFFARKFSSKKTPEILNLIDEYMLLNKTSEAGQYWPGFFDVDTTTPGKQWMQAHREKKRKEYDLWRIEKRKGMSAARGIVPSMKSYVTSMTSSSSSSSSSSQVTDSALVSSDTSTALTPYTSTSTSNTNDKENENVFKGVGFEGRREKKGRKGKRQSISNSFGAI